MAAEFFPSLKLIFSAFLHQGAIPIYTVYIAIYDCKTYKFEYKNNAFRLINYFVSLNMSVLIEECYQNRLVKQKIINWLLIP